LTYTPTQPYVIQSGKKKGKSVEQLMLSDYGWLRYMHGLLKKKSSGGKNQLHEHIEWALGRGENITLKKLCPQCGKRPAVFFSVLGSQRFGYSMSSAYTCCDDRSCIEKLKSQGIEKVPTLLKIVFSSSMKFRLKHDQRQITKIIRNCMMLPKRVTKEKLFEALR
jgi:hypothetical protein